MCIVQAVVGFYCKFIEEFSDGKHYENLLRFYRIMAISFSPPCRISESGTSAYEKRENFPR